jgi:hypothetical protein
MLAMEKRLRAELSRLTEALREYIRRRKQMQIVKLFGTIDFDPTYDYKKQRSRQ